MITTPTLNLEPTTPLTPSQAWDRIAAMFSQHLDSLKHLTDEQRGDIFTKTMNYKEALEMVARMVGDDVEDMDTHEAIAYKVGNKFIEHLYAAHS
jgi:hypothetical protein